VAAGIGLVMQGTAIAATAPIQLTLPPPTGPRRVGVLDLHLIDRSRPDTWVPAQPVRELMISIWYPARHAEACPVAPWLRRVIDRLHLWYPSSQ
jgi:hypothetical protein